MSSSKDFVVSVGNVFGASTIPFGSVIVIVGGVSVSTGLCWRVGGFDCGMR